MKLNLVVKAAGKLEGKVLPITLAQFVVGRDPQCQLRPASAMISKRHCAVIQREGKAYIRDFGSTNGTFVNDQPVKDEIELHHNDQLKIGPLVFQVQIAQDAPALKGATPKPPTKAVTDKAAAPTMTQAKIPGKTPPPPSKAPAITKTSVDLPSAGDTADDDIAAMLLSLQDDGDSPFSAADGVIPEGSTVMELIVPPGVDDPSKVGDKDKSKDKPKATGNTSSAAKSILEQYMKRPRG
jgi:predicted component of type VI protein secretion system